MKKTFPVNINGSIFYIDEDAYQLLNTYLEQLRSAFPGDEGKEIVTDIEARIAEIFSETIAGGAGVIVIEDINNIIEQMGRPADLGDGNADDEAPDSQNHTEEGAPKQEYGPTPPPFQAYETKKRLYRDENNKVFGGVLSGLACYAGWTTNVLRLLVVVLWFVFLCSAWPLSWSLIILYLLAWMIIPPARTAQQYLEMTGTPVTVSNVGQTILGTSAPNKDGNDKFLVSILSIIGKVITIIFGLMAAGVAIGSVVMLIMSICGLILYSGWNNVELLNGIGMFRIDHPAISAVAILSTSLAILIPCIAIIWGVCSVLFKAKGASKATIISAIVLEVILIIASIVLTYIAHLNGNFFCSIDGNSIQYISAFVASAIPMQA